MPAFRAKTEGYALALSRHFPCSAPAPIPAAKESPIATYRVDGVSGSVRNGSGAAVGVGEAVAAWRG